MSYFDWSIKPKLYWFVPRWAYVPRMWRELKCIFNAKSLLRICIGSIFLSVVVIAGFMAAVPLLVLPNIWRLVLSIPTLFILIVAQQGLLMLVPPMVTIRKDKIIEQHGQSARNIDAETITATFLTFHANDRVRLRICYTKKSKLQSRVIGVPCNVNFQKLTALLPIEPIVRDARTRQQPTTDLSQN